MGVVIIISSMLRSIRSPPSPFHSEGLKTQSRSVPNAGDLCLASSRH